MAISPFSAKINGDFAFKNMYDDLNKFYKEQKEKFIGIEDESGDRKYFTQIPNMIVNHSTAYEQSLYLIMKRLAGETGSCYASLNWLSKKMGAHRTSVSETINKLLKRKWIKEIEKKKVRGGQVRQFKIVDLWAINIKEYESASQTTTSRKCV